jgi:hypothetical protein
VGKGLGTAIAQVSPDVRRAKASQDMLAEQNKQSVAALNQQLRNPGLSVEQRAKVQKAVGAITQNTQDVMGQQAQTAQDVAAITDPRKQAASIGSIGFDIATLGVGTGGTKAVSAALKSGGIKQAAKTLGTQSAKTAGLAAPSGALFPVIEKGKDATIKDILTGAGTAAAFGAALPGISSGVAAGAKPIVKAIKGAPKLNQVGAIGKDVNPKIPSKIHPEDQAVMSDFIDYARKVYKPGAKETPKLELEASRLAEHYGLDTSKAKTVGQLADVFDKTLQNTKKSIFSLPKLNQGGYVQVPGKTPKATVPQAVKLGDGESLADYGITKLKNKADFDTAVTTVAKQTGESVDVAQGRVMKLIERGRESTAAGVPGSVSRGALTPIEGRAMKNQAVKEIMQDISKARGASEVESSQIAGSIASQAKQLGVKLDDGFINRYQTNALADDAEKQLGAHIKSITDAIFKKEQALNPDIQYRKNYVPQSYTQSDEAIAQAAHSLQTATGAANPRAFQTYAEAAQYGLTPKFKTIDQMIATSAKKAEEATRNKTLVDKGLKNGIFTTNNEGVPVIGIKSPSGEQVYANKKVADIINNSLQQGSGGLSKALHETAHVFGTIQDVMLQGGVPGTNANFFVFGQAVKDTTRNIGKFYHPIQAVKQETNLVGDIFRGKMATQKRFTEGSFKAGGQQVKNSDFVKGLANEGLYLEPQTSMSDIGKNAVQRGWNTLGNKPTFGRYMPNRNLSTAQEVYQQSIKKLGHDDAVKLAANTVKDYMGIVDELGKGRSNLTNDIMGVSLFAPKYRESIINALNNVVRSVIDPRTYGDNAYKPSRELATGMLITLAGYELLNRKLNDGKSMFDNREGQALSLQVPYGEKDAKGNQPVVNIPFMPGFMTIPRAAVGAVTAGARGDVGGVISQAGKALSAPLQTVSSVVSNQDFWGNPIRMDEKNATALGEDPASTGKQALQAAGYVAGQLSPAWVRGVVQQVSGKPTEQAIATALEAPIRFGKVMNPETTAYFKDREEIYQSLNKNDRAVWDAIHPPIKKNKSGEYLVDKTVDSGLARAANYLDHPEVLAAENEMAKRAADRGQKVDPLFTLPGDQQRIALRLDTLPPKDPNKKVLRADNPWFEDFSKARSAFFDSLPPGDPNKPKGPIAYPEASPQVASLTKAYYQLEDPSQRRQMLTDNPEIADQFAKEEQYSRAVRAAKDLPQYDKFPEPTKEVQNLLDFYSALPKGEANGKSKTRSAWIKSHPNEWAKLTEQFNKQALYNLEEDMKVAAFEGHDPTEKGIKAIASLDKSISGSAGGSYAGFYRKGGGGSGGTIAETYNPYKYNVSLTAGGSVAKPKVAVRATGAAKSQKVAKAKPKVSIKKSTA